MSDYNENIELPSRGRPKKRENFIEYFGQENIKNNEFSKPGLFPSLENESVLHLNGRNKNGNNVNTNKNVYDNNIKNLYGATVYDRSDNLNQQNGNYPNLLYDNYYKKNTSDFANSRLNFENEIQALKNSNIRYARNNLSADENIFTDAEQNILFQFLLEFSSKNTNYLNMNDLYVPEKNGFSKILLVRACQKIPFLGDELAKIFDFRSMTFKINTREDYEINNYVPLTASFENKNRDSNDYQNDYETNDDQKEILDSENENNNINESLLENSILQNEIKIDVDDNEFENDFFLENINNQNNDFDKDCDFEEKLILNELKICKNNIEITDKKGTKTNLDDEKPFLSSENAIQNGVTPIKDICFDDLYEQNDSINQNDIDNSHETSVDYNKNDINYEEKNLLKLSDFKENDISKRKNSDEEDIFEEFYNDNESSNFEKNEISEIKDINNISNSETDKQIKNDFDENIINKENMREEKNNNIYKNQNERKNTEETNYEQQNEKDLINKNSQNRGFTEQNQINLNYHENRDGRNHTESESLYQNDFQSDNTDNLGKQISSISVNNDSRNIFDRNFYTEPVEAINLQLDNRHEIDSNREIPDNLLQLKIDKNQKSYNNNFNNNVSEYKNENDEKNYVEDGSIKNRHDQFKDCMEKVRAVQQKKMFEERDNQHFENNYLPNTFSNRPNYHKQENLITQNANKNEDIHEKINLVYHTFNQNQQSLQNFKSPNNNILKIDNHYNQSNQNISNGNNKNFYGANDQNFNKFRQQNLENVRGSNYNLNQKSNTVQNLNFINKQNLNNNNIRNSSHLNHQNFNHKDNQNLNDINIKNYNNVRKQDLSNFESQNFNYVNNQNFINLQNQNYNNRNSFTQVPVSNQVINKHLNTNDFKLANNNISSNHIKSDSNLNYFSPTNKFNKNMKIMNDSPNANSNYKYTEGNSNMLSYQNFNIKNNDNDLTNNKDSNFFVSQIPNHENNLFYHKNNSQKIIDENQLVKSYNNRTYTNQNLQNNNTDNHNNQYKDYFRNPANNYIHEDKTDKSQQIFNNNIDYFKNIDNRIENKKNIFDRFNEAKNELERTIYCTENSKELSHISNNPLQSYNKFDQLQANRSYPQPDYPNVHYKDISPNHFMSENPWLNRKKRKTSPLLWNYLNKNRSAVSSMIPTQASHIEFMKGHKAFIGHLKKPMNTTEKKIVNYTILPLLLNSNYYDNNVNSEEFILISNAFNKKIENIDYENITVQQLKTIMKEFGLNHTGKKVELIERMKETSDKINVKMQNVKGGKPDDFLSMESKTNVFEEPFLENKEEKKGNKQKKDDNPYDFFDFLHF
ncbi:hypothetical protein GVAV_003337 [Gurleya vavrai]